MPQPKHKHHFPLVFVEWEDSCEPADNSEVPIPDDIPEPMTILSVGHMIRETESYVTLAGGYKPDLRTADYVITIVKSAIIGKVERLEFLSDLSSID